MQKQNIGIRTAVLTGFIFAFFIIFSPMAGAASSDVVLSEVLANAQDEDTGEFVELYNKGDVPVDVAGWLLKDTTDTNDPLKDYAGTYDIGVSGTMIAPGGFAIVVDPDYAGQYNDSIGQNASLSAVLMLTIDGDKTLGNGLSNAQDTIILDDKNGYAATFSWVSDAGDVVSFQKIDLRGEEATINWAGNNSITPGSFGSAGGSTTTPPATQQQTATPSAQTTIQYTSSVRQNRVPIALAGDDVVVNVGTMVEFNGQGSTDADGNSLSYAWNFGDGRTEAGMAVSHQYSFPGTYYAVLTVSDGSYTGSDQLAVNVYASGIIISEFLSNPEGADEKNEWIEIHNGGERVADIGLWMLMDRSGKKFTLPAHTYIKGGGYLVLSSDATGITLNNSNEELSLLYPNGEISDKVSFAETAKEGYSAALFGDKFLWTNALTPGYANLHDGISKAAPAHLASSVGSDTRGTASKITSTSSKKVSVNNNGVVSLLVSVAEAKTVEGYSEEDAVGGDAGTAVKKETLLEKSLGAVGAVATGQYLFWLLAGVIPLAGIAVAARIYKK